MMRILLFCFVGAIITGCNNSSGGGSSSQNEISGGEIPIDPATSGGSIVCLFREPLTKVYYAGYGDTNALAAEIGVEVCRNLAPANANCTVTPQCEVRKAGNAWTCTVRNTRTGDLWTDQGRSRLETFSFMHGICRAGINASAEVCTSLEQSVCVENH